MVEKYVYDVYGKPEILDSFNQVRTSSFFGNRYMFTGREWQGSIDLYDYRNRYYSAELGRFLQRDPAGFNSGDLNLYRYVFNDPVGNVDPLGLYATSKEAGEAGARAASALTKAHPKKVEYCGRVCYSCKDGKEDYYFTGPMEGISDKKKMNEIKKKHGITSNVIGMCLISATPKCEKGDKQIGRFHSHPAGSKHNKWDKKAADDTQEESWVGQGGDKVDYYKPKPKPSQ